MHFFYRQPFHVAMRAVTLMVAGAVLCACSQSPSRNILGSYFPTWMLCALVGIVGTFVLRAVLVKADIDQDLPVPVLVYLSLWIAITLAVWLFWLG
ncbi:YtcA family lipoprotein [Dyella sp.]|uniref:YtcA family lipoprotein n=1 Tax=Dyella sp. TaxID=1869338 RepID=UPI002ED1040C